MKPIIGITSNYDYRDAISAATQKYAINEKSHRALNDSVRFSFSFTRKVPHNDSK